MKCSACCTRRRKVRLSFSTGNFTKIMCSSTFLSAIRSENNFGPQETAILRCMFNACSVILVSACFAGEASKNRTSHVDFRRKEVCLFLSVSVKLALSGDPDKLLVRVVLLHRRICSRTHGTRQIILAFNTRPATFRTILCRKLSCPTVVQHRRGDGQCEDTTCEVRRHW